MRMFYYLFAVGSWVLGLVTWYYALIEVGPGVASAIHEIYFLLLAIFGAIFIVGGSLVGVGALLCGAFQRIAEEAGRTSPR